MFKPLTFAFAAAVLLAVAAACLPSSGPSFKELPTPTPDASGTGDTLSPFREALALMPDTPDTRDLLYLVDYNLLYRNFGPEMPGPDATQADFAVHKDELYASTPDWANGYWLWP